MLGTSDWTKVEMWYKGDVTKGGVATLDIAAQSATSDSLVHPLVAIAARPSDGLVIQ
jgi:hypothetical protein